jgi:hypothetical protein
VKKSMSDDIKPFPQEEIRRQIIKKIKPIWLKPGGARITDDEKQNGNSQ